MIKNKIWSGRSAVQWATFIGGMIMILLFGIRSPDAPRA